MSDAKKPFIPPEPPRGPTPPPRGAPLPPGIFPMPANLTPAQLEAQRLQVEALRHNIVSRKWWTLYWQVVAIIAIGTVGVAIGLVSFQISVQEIARLIWFYNSVSL